MKGYECVSVWLWFAPPKGFPCVLLVSEIHQITDYAAYALLKEVAEIRARGQLCALEVPRGV